MHLLPIWILPNLLCLKPHRLHSVLDRAPWMDLIVNWDGLQFSTTRNTCLYLFYILFYFQHCYMGQWPPHTGSACFPIIISVISQLAVQDGHQTHTLPVLSETACVLQSHFTWPLCTNHIFAAGPTRLYPHLACPTLSNTAHRQVSVHIWLFYVYYFSCYKKLAK
jgi:hypothetical protein